MKDNSRTKNSIFNISSNISTYFIKIILSFITRTIFIKVLGELYLGVNGLLTNVLSMLSLAELGISSAISFSLYKPLAENDIRQISILMSFFKRVYSIIGCIVSLLGIILFFFLDKIIPEYNQIPNLDIIYFLYLINTVSTYYVAYKEILITADQKAYKLTKINIFFTSILYIIQIIVLLVFKNFIFYLLTQFFIQITQKIATNKFITKEYEKVDYNIKEKLSEDTSGEIKKNVKAMFLHKIGDYCINGTDNIIISTFINVVTVGLYSNYLTLINMINTIITMIYNNITASFGNLLVSNNKEKSLEVFKKLDFSAFILYSFFGILFANLGNIFIEIWIGNEYLLSQTTVVLLSFSFFFTGTRVASSVARNAAGLYDKDKFVPIIQSVINLVISIALSIYIGIDGVILGTIISSILPCFYRSYILYKNIFKKSYLTYLKEYYIKYILFFVFDVVLIVYISNKIAISGISGLLILTLLTIFIYLIGIIVVFKKYNEFKYLLDIVKNFLKKFKINIRS